MAKGTAGDGHCYDEDKDENRSEQEDKEASGQCQERYHKDAAQGSQDNDCCAVAALGPSVVPLCLIFLAILVCRCSLGMKS